MAGATTTFDEVTPSGQATREAGSPTPGSAHLRVRLGGTIYPAEPVAKGAAFEILSRVPAPGFLTNRLPGAQFPYRCFIPAVEAEVVDGTPPAPDEHPMLVPVRRDVSWQQVHQLSQNPRGRTDWSLATARGTVLIRRGTRMMKIISGAQLAGYLSGWMPQGFCYREFDIAHLRTPAELAVLCSDGAATGTDEAIFAVRWRAVDPHDYTIPYVEEFPGLVAMSPRDRRGPPVLGTGFAPSDRHLVPEFVTADLGDLPLPAYAELVAFTSDGTCVMLYRYLPEQRAWTGMFGPQWHHLLTGVPGISPDQDYYAIPASPVRLVGDYRGQGFEVFADPPDEFRVLAKTRFARYQIETLGRQTPRAAVRGVPVTVIRDDGPWLRVRLTRPDAEAIALTSATCVERGIYEVWAPAGEVTDRHDALIRFAFTPPAGPTPRPQWTGQAS
jgi:hypothetical protein